ncbi:hypothetical protein ABZ281_29975 [Streptomyces sp. NPDC006265]|uniref:hypothetical protein n=1 Tax=Streptomyces sp. NPDC006265 TaxID=3156740 RepID=UPI0033BCC888
MNNVDVRAVTDALVQTLQDAGAPPRAVEGAASLEGPPRNAVRTVVDRTVTGVITSDAFQQAWEGANRRSHATVVNMLTGDREGALTSEGGTVRLDVGEIVDQVRERLVDAGFDTAAAIPDADRTITLFETEQLGKAQDAMRLLDVLGARLPVLTVVLAALAVRTAPAHRVMLMITAAGVGVMMAVLLVALAVLRRAYLASVPPTALPGEAAAVIYDTFVRFLRDSTLALLAGAVITALVAYLYGPGRLARGVRATADRATTATGRALSQSACAPVPWDADLQITGSGSPEWSWRPELSWPSPAWPSASTSPPPPGTGRPPSAARSPVPGEAVRAVPCPL